MSKKHQAEKDEVKTIEIEKSMFFPEDFKRLPKGVIVYIEKGKLISIKGRRYKIIEKWFSLME